MLGLHRRKACHTFNKGAAGEAETLGRVFDGVLLRTSSAPKKRAVRALLSWRNVTGRKVDILVSHCTFAGIVQKTTLVAFHSVHRFIRVFFSVENPAWEHCCSFARSGRVLTDSGTLGQQPRRPLR